MTTNTDVMDDLDLFSAALFGGEPDATPEPEKEDDVNDESVLEDDTLAPEDEVDDEAEEVLDEEPKPVEKPKSRFQERIDELTTDKRVAQREAEELRQRLEDALAKLNAVPQKTEEKAPQKVDNGPDVDEVLDDGSAKYPLGEFDPAYIRDLTRHALRRELEDAKAADAEAARQAQLEEARTALQDEWTGKLKEAIEDKYPDMLEKNKGLQSRFGSLDPAYGEFLANTIMSMEYGTDVLYHLGSNPEEAQKIVDAGPARAALALGRLEARFAYADEERREPKPKVSKAPVPPSRLNKGSMVSKDVADDTDDLDAFAEKLFNKKSKRW